MAKKDRMLRIILFTVLAVCLAGGSVSFLSPSFLVSRFFTSINIVLTGSEEPVIITPYFALTLKAFGAFCLCWSLFLVKAIKDPGKNIFVIRGTSMFLFLNGISSFWIISEKQVADIIHPAILGFRGVLLTAFAVILYFLEPRKQK